MYKKIILTFYIFAISSGDCINSDLINALSDFFKTQKEPTKVTTFICWKNKYVVDLMKKLNRYNIFMATHPVGKLTNKNIKTFQPAEHQFYLLDMDCDHAENILVNANKMKLLKFPYRWMILQNCTNEHDFSNYDILLNSRIYRLNKCKTYGKYSFDSIYFPSKRSNVTTNEVAVWNNGFEYFNRLSDIRDRSNQMGLDMNVTLVFRYNESQYDLVHMRDRKKDAVSKHNYILVSHIVEILNVTVKYIHQNSWGYPDPKTGLYNGLFGDLIYGVSEFAGAPLFMTQHRIPYVDYVAETTLTEGRFIFRAPPLSAVTNIFSRPFNFFVWVACGVTLFIILFVMYIIIKWEWTIIAYQEMHGEENIGVLKPTLIDVIQLEIGAVCQQGAEAEPKSNSGRVAMFFIFLSLMFLYTAYSANIVALLQSTTNGIRTLEDLYNSKIELGVYDVEYHRYHFPRQKRPIQLLINKKAIPHNFMSLDEGLGKIRNGYFGFFAECDAVYKAMSDSFLEHEKCGLVEIKYWAIISPWMPIRKNSTYKEIIKIAFMEMDERGIRDRNYKKLYTTKPKCQNQGANFTQVNVNDCYFALVIFAIGLSLSLLLLGLEALVHKTQAISKIEETYSTLKNNNLKVLQIKN